ncbi:hypothetical protein OL239_02505 [Arthrobacter sp. ATA002]|uniref:hypothetical protein n=1 Tax=Arthrobacter sp. ATA002 TaxID=2991715 RepID=UPI0022A7B913|nr:hypothetical protein [Arthrobacter sp. ATA002]WAP52196.1 hypothetical protein OL239_02505 [Arthrobacter sp. ATA002]
MTRTTAVAVTFAAVLAGCTAPDGVPADDPRSTPILALDEFETQELKWGACDDYAITDQEKENFPLAPEAECARMLVPASYADPAGDTASVAVVRVPARGESTGSLFFNPGVRAVLVCSERSVRPS